MHSRLHHALLTIVAVCSMAGAAQAAVHIISVPIDGNQPVPPSGSPGTGSALVTLDDVTGSVSVDGSYSGLLGDQTVAHIHGPAPAGQNAGVVVGLVGTGGTSGTLTGGGTLTAAQVQDMLAGLHYINIHSTQFPGGEIRGQIDPAMAVPTVGEWGLIALTLGLIVAAVIVLRRRMPATA